MEIYSADLTSVTQSLYFFSVCFLINAKLQQADLSLDLSLFFLSYTFIIYVDEFVASFISPKMALT